MKEFNLKIFAYFAAIIISATGVFLLESSLFDNYPILYEKYEANKEELKKTKYVYIACGKIKMLDKFVVHDQHGKANINYFVTYFNEYKGEYETLDVKPHDYQKCKELQEKGRKVCFSYFDKTFYKDKENYSAIVFFQAILTIAFLIFFIMLIDAIIMTY